MPAGSANWATTLADAAIADLGVFEQLVRVSHPPSIAWVGERRGRWTSVPEHADRGWQMCPVRRMSSSFADVIAPGNQGSRPK